MLFAVYLNLMNKNEEKNSPQLLKTTQSTKELIPPDTTKRKFFRFFIFHKMKAIFFFICSFIFSTMITTSLKFYEIKTLVNWRVKWIGTCTFGF